MKLHRFYVQDLELKSDFWLHDENILRQWNKVLRFKPSQQVVLFDGKQTDKLYEIKELSTTEAHLIMKTELKQTMPNRHIYLFWSLLKSDKNDLILQKCTELGVSNFVPIISKRSIRKNFNKDRAQRIVLEASEQCGRSDIPKVRDPIKLETAIAEYKNKIELIFCDELGDNNKKDVSGSEPTGLFIGPEGGWDDSEIELFKAQDIKHLNIHNLTLRAETAAIVAVSQLI